MVHDMAHTPPLNAAHLLLHSVINSSDCCVRRDELSPGYGLTAHADTSAANSMTGNMTDRKSREPELVASW